MIISTKLIEPFLKEYADHHHIKPVFTCKIAFFSGPMRQVEFTWLKSLDLCFRYIKGDNRNNYKLMGQELACNTIIHKIAKHHKLLKYTTLSKQGYAYLFIIFDKELTPFDNCIDLKLALYENHSVVRLPHKSSIVSQTSTLFDDEQSFKLEQLLYEIHKKGFVLNKIHLVFKVSNDDIISLSDFKYLTSHAKSRAQKQDTKKLKKALKRLTKDDNEDQMGFGCFGCFGCCTCMSV